MYKSLGLFVFAIFAYACQSSNQQEITRYHEDGRAKPVVAIASMIDSTSSELLWSLSDEFTALIKNDLENKNELYLLEQQDYEGSTPSNESPFNNEFSWVKTAFSPNEFVVFMELVEHEDVPAEKIDGHASTDFQETSYNLTMKVRLRIIDLRKETPKVVLQEYLDNAYFVPKNLIRTDYNRVVFGTREYEETPMSIAHSTLAKEIAERVSDYILLAKSR